MSAPLKHLPTEGYREVGGVFPAQDSAAHAPCPGMEGGLLRLCQGKTSPSWSSWLPPTSLPNADMG